MLSYQNMWTPFLRKLFKSLQILVFVLALGGIAYLLKKDFEAETFRQMLSSAHLSWLALATLLTGLGIVVKAIRLQAFGRMFGLPLGFGESFNIQVISISFGILTPGRAGEFSKVLLLSQGDKTRRPLALWIMLLERLGDLLTLGCFALLFSLYAFPQVLLPGPWQSMAMLGLLALVITVFLRFLLRHPRLRDLLQSTLSHRWFAPLKQLQPFPTLWIATLTLCAWILDGCFQAAILISIGIFLSPLLTVGINAVVAIAGIFSVLPIGLGTVDFSALVLYQQQGHLNPTAIVFLLGAGRVLGLGLLLLLFGGVALRHPTLLRRSRQAAVAAVDAQHALENAENGDPR